MAIKRKWTNFPTTEAGGHYFYYDEDNSSSLIASDSLPPNLDKFNNSALYTIVQESLVNKLILKYGLGALTDSQIKINSMVVNNNGVSLPTTKSTVRIWLFDSESWINAGGNTSTLDNGNYDDISSGLGNNVPNSRFFNYRKGGEFGEGKGFGEVIRNDIILSDLVSIPNTTFDLQTRGAIETYNIAASFEPGTGNGVFDTTGTGQDIYFVIQTFGSGWRKYRRDKSRKARFTVYKIPIEELFTGTTGKVSPSLDLQPINIKDGGSGKYKTPFKVDKFEIYVDSNASDTQNYDTTDTNPTIDFSWGSGGSTDTIPNYNYNEIEDLRPDVLFPTMMNLRNLFQGLRTQQVSSEIRGHKFLNTGNNDSFSTAIQRNFEPVAKVNILGNSDYDLSAYQINEIDRQLCSAPNQVELGFYISEYFEGDGILTQTDGYGIGKFEGYKFYVLDWNDVNNKFNSVEDYLIDIPQNDTDMLKKQNQNLYKFADLSETLVHNYSTPGMKIIKAVLFSHLPNYDNSQIVRWKFIETRIFLDIPITKYPDFGELGGQDFTTIPWPYTTPIINGISEDSKYKISVQNTLSGGKLAENEIIDIRFLEEANENDELGKSIKKMDLEQVRYFNTGSLDMTQLLQIPIVINETEMQDVQVGESFSDTSWPGPKYIAWNEETNACRETKEMGTDLNNNEYNYDYLCASEYPDVPFITTGGADNSSTATLCCYRKFDTPPLYHQWIAETCGNNGIIEGDPYGGGYKSYECKLALFEEQEVVISSEFNPHTDTDYWDCRDWDLDRNYCFSEETSVGQIFIDDNLDLDLKQKCALELNLGELDGKTLSDTNGNPNKGILIGDYKVKKRQKNVRMKRDSFIKLPKKGTSDGAL